MRYQRALAKLHQDRPCENPTCDLKVVCGLCKDHVEEGRCSDGCPGNVTREAAEASE